MRLNYSILNKANDKQALLDYWNGVEGFKNEAMTKGIELHEKIKDTKFKLSFMKQCKWEYHFEFVDDVHVVSGYIDCMDKDYLVDWKRSKNHAGKQDATQLYFYDWCLRMCDLKGRKYGLMVQVDDDMNILSKAMYELGKDMGKWYVERRDKILEYYETAKKDKLIKT